MAFLNTSTDRPEEYEVQPLRGLCRLNVTGAAPQMQAMQSQKFFAAIVGAMGLPLEYPEESQGACIFDQPSSVLLDILRAPPFLPGHPGHPGRFPGRAGRSRESGRFRQTRTTTSLRRDFEAFEDSEPQTSLLDQVKGFTEELFPGPIEVERVEDQEIPGETYVVLNVRATGSIEEIAEKQRQWHRALLRLTPGLAHAFQISIDAQ